MGMFDYIDGEQVKLFYRPYLSGKNGDIFHSGGELRGFGVGDELPLKTSYYKYPKDFMIFTSLCGNNTALIIRNGSFVKEVLVEKLDKDEFISPVITKYGDKLNIDTYDELFEYIEAREERQLIVSDYRNLSEDGISTHVDKFEKRWFVDDEYEDLKRYGEMLNVIESYVPYEPQSEQLKEINRNLDLGLETVKGKVAELQKDEEFIKRYNQWQEED